MEYLTWHRQSVEAPETFWATEAEHLEWQEPWRKVFAPGKQPYQGQWFVGGKLNISVNCLDRHVQSGQGKRIAYHWIDESGVTESITYSELLEQVSRAANVLRAQGVKKGDRVVLYLPHTIQHIVAVLACARLGAIHSIVFAGFSAPALQTRIRDTGAKLLLTATWTQRRGKRVNLLPVARQAQQDCPALEKTIIWNRSDEELDLAASELDWQTLIEAADTNCSPEPTDSEDPLFILYTSGTTGQPKGIVHTVGGYAVAAQLTTRTSFDLHGDDIYWCTADPGWITGHTYGIYGPLLNGTTSIIAEGAPDFPNANRWWSIIEQFGVTVWYTVPTAVRLLMRYGDAVPQAHNLASLRVMGSVGEPINPAAWQWLFDIVGQGKVPIVDTWWQTETGSHMLATQPHLPQKPGVAGLPCAGVAPLIVDDQGQPVSDGHKGFLVLTQPWPSMFRTCWNDQTRHAQYWERFPPYYFTGDMAVRDSDGYIQVLGRSDDVLNIAGHRLGTAEIESALVLHPTVAEAAAIALPDELTGEKLHAFVLLNEGIVGSSELEEKLREQVKKEIGRFAVVAEFSFTSQLPKTRSGKIMRRVLRAQALGQDPGDMSTLEG